jgi:hypothetical protein
MKKQIGTTILAGALIVCMAFPLTAVAGQKGGNAKMSGNQTRVGAMHQTRTQARIHKQARIRDNSSIINKDRTELETRDWKMTRDQDRDQLRDDSGLTE